MKTFDFRGDLVNEFSNSHYICHILCRFLASTISLKTHIRNECLHHI